MLDSRRSRAEKPRLGLVRDRLDSEMLQIIFKKYIPIAFL